MAERSPSVHYANWKEDMLLQKQLQVINRSERSVVHRIRIEQKVLFKRFQDKLYRSKLSESRLLGDKERERELRSKQLHGLNTDFGNTEEDYSFLKKLKHTPCTGKGNLETRRKHTAIKKSPGKRKRKENKVDIIIDEYFKDKSQNVPRYRSNSVSEGMPLEPPIASASQVTGNILGIPQITLTLRPSTTDGQPSRVPNGYFPQDKRLSGFCRANNTSEAKDSRNKLNLINSRPFTSSPRTTINSIPVEKVQRSNSKTDGPSQKSAAFFEEEQKVSLVEERLNEIKRLNYDSKINDFYETLNSLQSATVPDSDYYTIRLQSAMKEMAAHQLVDVPGTPEKEYKRHLGNLDVMSLTFKKLNMNFRKDHVASSDSFKPDFIPLVFDDDDESSDDDSDD